ncbi:MAG: class I SAM-dependent methyltransferase [Desulfobaccales bacterium]
MIRKSPICDSLYIQVHHSEHRRGIPLRFEVCNQCNVVFQNPHPSQSCLRRFFSSSLFIGEQGNKPQDDCIAYYDYSAWEKCYKKNAEPILSLLGQIKPPPAKLLEIGGATGWFLKAAKDSGYDVEGLDISSTLADLVRNRYNINVKVSSIEEADFADEYFDIVCNFGGIGCWYEPHKAFNNVNRILKKGGIFCFNFTDYKSIIAKLRGGKFFEYNHASLFIYTADAIKKLLENHSFKVYSESIHYQYASIGRILSYLKYNKLYRLANTLHIDNIAIKVPVISTKIVMAIKCNNE